MDAASLTRDVATLDAFLFEAERGLAPGAAERGVMWVNAWSQVAATLSDAADQRRLLAERMAEARVAGRRMLSLGLGSIGLLWMAGMTALMILAA